MKRSMLDCAGTRQLASIGRLRAGTLCAWIAMLAWSTGCTTPYGKVPCKDCDPWIYGYPHAGQYGPEAGPVGHAGHSVYRAGGGGVHGGVLAGAANRCRSACHNVAAQFCDCGDPCCTCGESCNYCHERSCGCEPSCGCSAHCGGECACPSGDECGEVPCEQDCCPPHKRSILSCHHYYDPEAGIFNFCTPPAKLGALPPPPPGRFFPVPVRPVFSPQPYPAYAMGAGYGAGYGAANGPGAGACDCQ